MRVAGANAKRIAVHPIQPVFQGKTNMKPSSKVDIVVYGATGFTGQLVAEYLAAHYAGKADLKWAMAGRSLDKLASVRRCDRRAGGYRVDRRGRQRSGVAEAMLDRTRSVLSTVGPYQLYGSELVAACAATGTIISISAASRSGCGR